jgi:hypothetical protein
MLIRFINAKSPYQVDDKFIWTVFTTLSCLQSKVQLASYMVHILILNSFLREEYNEVVLEAINDIGNLVVSGTNEYINDELISSNDFKTLTQIADTTFNTGVTRTIKRFVLTYMQSVLTSLCWTKYKQQSQGFTTMHI